MAKTNSSPKHGGLYLGVDVGATKIQASLAEECGAIVGRCRRPTPQKKDPGELMAALQGAMSDLLAERGLESTDLRAIGVAVPGAVDAEAGRVVFASNLSIVGLSLVADLEKRFGVPVVLDNDGNLGILGERWLGSARHAHSAIGIFVGTGIGGGFVQGETLWRGWRGTAMEMGHIIMQLGGPKCGCGSLGCFEALAGRLAIERDIRQALAQGRKTVMKDRLDEDPSRIRSGALRDALAAGDKPVTEILRRASEVIGHACVSMCRLLDPEVIVLGGGVCEACGDFMLPIARKVMQSDALAAVGQGNGLLLAALGDDAIVLGAVALARRRIGRSPFDDRFQAAATYPPVAWPQPGRMSVGDMTCAGDVTIRVNGKVKAYKKALDPAGSGLPRRLGLDALAKTCQGGPELLIVGTGRCEAVQLPADSRQYLARRAIEPIVLPTDQAVQAYNTSKKRRAAIFFAVE